MIRTLAWKDLKLFLRHRFLAVATGLSMLAYLIIYILLPSEMSDAPPVAIHIGNPDQTNVDEAFAKYFQFEMFDSEQSLRDHLMESRKHMVGLSISAEDAQSIDRLQPANVDVFYGPNIPAEVKSIYSDMVTLMANAASPMLSSRVGRMEDRTEVLGKDIYGKPIAIRDRILPLFLLFLTSIEVLGLATIISQEVESGTARAVLTSPLRSTQFFLAKAVFGVGLALAQLLLLVALTGNLAKAPGMLIATLALGALMTTGFAFIIAAISKTPNAVMGWGTLLIIVFIIPAMSVMLPGLSTRWGEIIPSFYLVDSLHNILNFDAMWSDIARNLWMLVAVSAVTLTMGTVLLKREFAG